ncbi:hypothetical protein ID866_6798 [Astraeus odoratus]|nr:hypothetical protein ID866_6798 [Astraeus odoratus]
MENSLGQEPCVVAAYARVPCYGAEWIVYPLDSDTYYIGPDTSNANACQCNTVTYSLLSACTACQNSTDIPSWSLWSYNCSTTYSEEYPEDIPEGTAFPHWAYQDVAVCHSFVVPLSTHSFP